MRMDVGKLQRGLAEQIAKSMAKNGGTTQGARGERGFRFPMFGPLSGIGKFYHSDEDFPASVTLLWEENTLQYLLYETVFYAAGVLLQAIQGQL